MNAKAIDFLLAALFAFAVGLPMIFLCSQVAGILFLLGVTLLVWSFAIQQGVIK